MRKILILTGRYLPGYRDGGPVRTIVNLVSRMGSEYDFRIMCLDRDHGDSKRYPGIKVSEYNEVGHAGVWYTERFTEEEVLPLAKAADVVYCCGPYNDYARIVMRLKKKKAFDAPLYIASMGSFSPEAFRIKGIKKRLYVLYLKCSKLIKDVTWSVTSEREEDELKAVLGKDSRCVIATDIPREDIAEHTHVKEKGSLKLIFLSRISRKKNLGAIPSILKKLDDRITVKVDIYGTCEDAGYLHECMEQFDELKKTHPLCKWEYKKEAASEDVPGIFAAYDAFIFPTLGENYGHVVAESLAAGTPVVISDTTPWTDLGEKGCGYVCGSGDTDAFAKALSDIADMDEEQMEKMRNGCYAYIREKNAEILKCSGYRRIFG